MSQHTHDEKVALVEKAKGIVGGKIKSAKVTLRGETLESSGGAFNFYTQELNLLLALQSFFKRHEAIHGCDKHEQCDLFICRTCETAYPCPESVTTADVIVNGTSK